MTWIKLDDLLPQHPKVLAAPEAFGLYVAGLCWTSSQGTNGFIPEAAIPRLLALVRIPRLRTRLVEVGLWVEVPGGIEIHAYLKHNRSAEEIAALKAKRAEVGAKGGSTPKAKSKQLASGLLLQAGSKTQAEADTEADTEAEKATPPYGSPPAGGQTRRTQLPTDFKPNDTGVSLCRKEGLDLQRELARFTDHHRSRGTVMLDWQAAWRTWVRKAQDFRPQTGNNGARPMTPEEDAADTERQAQQLIAMSGWNRR
jgi:hypothetical protein